MKKEIILLLVILSLFIFPDSLDAQCSMCRSVAESSLENGPSVARGLNKGILYMMGVPYILLMGLAFIFRKSLLGKIKG